MGPGEGRLGKGAAAKHGNGIIRVGVALTPRPQEAFVEPLTLTCPTTPVDGRAVVDVRGDVDLMSADRLRQALAQAVAVSPHVTVDLTEVGFIDSSGLSALVWGHRQAEEAGGSLQLRRPSPMLRRLLELTRLETILTIDEDDDEPASTPED